MVRRTRLGSLLLAVGWGCFPLALVRGSLAPALLGALLVALVATRRPPPPVVSCRRDVPADLRVDAPFEVVTTAEGPADAPLFLDDPPPGGARLLDWRLEAHRGRARLVQRLVVETPGALTWPRVEARVQDAWGVAEDRLVVPLRQHLHVLPADAPLVQGSRLARHARFRARSRGRAAHDEEPELERLREYQAGDRLRDVDWPRTAKLQRLIVRQMTRTPVRPVVVLVDATDSMRLARRHSKLGTAVHAGLAIAAAARATGLPVGFVAWSERGVEGQVRVLASSSVLSRAVVALASLPPAGSGHVPAPAEGTVTSTDVPTPAERAFLLAAGAFSLHARGETTPVEAALHAVGKVSPQPSTVFALVDAEHNPALAETIARRLRQRGHRPVVVAFRSGPHHYALPEVDARAAAQLVAWRRNRERARRALAAQKVPFVTLGPDVASHDLQEVVASAR